MTRDKAPDANASTPDCSQAEAAGAAWRGMSDVAAAGEGHGVATADRGLMSDAIATDAGMQLVAPIPSPTRLGRVAIFAGTAEGHELCRALAAHGMGAMAFVATGYGAELLADLPGIEVRAGRLSEPEMEAALTRLAPDGPTASRSPRFDVIVDATHPYAAEVSANIRTAAGYLGIRYLRLLRPATLEDVSAPDGPRIVEVPNAAAAVRFLEGTEGPVLLTTGSKDLPTFAMLPNFATRLYARILPDAAAVARARELGFQPAHLICMQGPFPREMNVATLRMVGARWMVTKDAGRPGGMPEKIAAAQEAGVGLVVLARPPEPGNALSFERVLGLLVGEGQC